MSRSSGCQLDELPMPRTWPYGASVPFKEACMVNGSNERWRVSSFYGDCVRVHICAHKRAEGTLISH
ncbi:hypothetical protein Agabi119p4_7249 [Agaricus bisporus var. burnettii]|uniref:Uncharacterized protein n=1 Tax=Agaricus bisporus var. burnettii TaxID=192524 RepID=A0A8H7EYU9_AGABI|nr:hypothetical protein Agabi119p4_7249 [Agaricus bisporus var. burnettii]